MKGVFVLSGWINRHAMLRKHKHKLKKRFGYGVYTGYRTNIKKQEAEWRERYGDWPNARNGGYDYWTHCYLTGPRKVAKDGTNGVIRSEYRQLLNTFSDECADDIVAPQNSDYRKMFDYNWTVW